MNLRIFLIKIKNIAVQKYQPSFHFSLNSGVGCGCVALDSNCYEFKFSQSKAAAIDECG